MNYLITIPATPVTLAPERIDPLTRAVITPEKLGNKFLENLKGLIGEKSKEVSIFDSITNFGDIWKALCLAETTLQLVLTENDFKKLFEIVKNHKGWGDFAGQVECYTALETATKQ